MDSVIYSPQDDFDSKYEKLHSNNTDAFFEKLVKLSGVDIEKNRETVKLYNEYTENLTKLKRKLLCLRILRVIMCIIFVFLPLVIWWLTPKIRKLRTEVAEADQKAAELLALAHEQMRSLNSLFTDRDAFTIIEETIPLISFDENLSVKQEADMKINYDFYAANEDEQSTSDTLAGNYNENPFLFENKKVHTMGTETYYGYKTIHWTETYRDSNGKLRTRTRTQRLEASVTKPKPYYKTQVVLNYCAQGGPDLSFSRDASHLQQKNERQIERYVKRGEKRLTRNLKFCLMRLTVITRFSSALFSLRLRKPIWLI